ncbi:MAG: YbhB/YbcL family Raf kinase inhibitor-like protein [Thermodesulfobacteriota bacterium]
MRLTSLDFEDGGVIPREMTCDGKDVSPELMIEGVPEGTKSLALIMDDLDTPRGTFVHWLAWNIPADTTRIEHGKEPKGTQGTIGFGGKGYRGPCPPSGTHRYFFKLYALDKEIELKEGSRKVSLEEAMEGHILEKAELMGTYQRS